MGTHRIRPRLVAALSVVLALTLFSSAAGADNAYAADLIARARAANLADHRQWRALVHYELGALGGVSSLIDSPTFFAAPDGKTDPRAELEATIKSFFAQASPPMQPPQCLRPARYRWLKEELQFDPDRLEEHICPEFEAWFGTLNAAAVTLAYPSAYLNNPSSMFGHTLLRIDRPRQREDTRLLSFAINFAADTGTDGGALFALKGLAGGYQGFFSVMLYYEKVGQYSDIENRDMWEYQLKLKPDEIRRILEHLWELQGQYINYYFLSTNCSYVLLSLINVARPGLDLTRGLDLYAIPVDTVRAAIRSGELLGDVVFRPSGMTRIKNLRSGLDAVEQSFALALTEGGIEPHDPGLADLPAATRARVLELAQAMMQYRLNTGSLDRDVVAPRSLDLLRGRAAIAGSRPTVGAPPAVRPDEGHESVQLSSSVGMTGTNPFVEVGLRPAFHDLLDPPAGYPTGAAIEILGVRARAYFGDLPRLESFTPVAINSLAPRDRFFRPMSWRTKLGVERFREDGDDAGWLVGLLEGAAGGTWAMGANGQVSALVGASLFADHESPEAGIVGAGPEIVASWPLTPWWTTAIEARWQATAGSDRLSDRYRAALGQGFHLGRNLSLRVEAGVRNDGGAPLAEWMTSLKWYF